MFDLLSDFVLALTWRKILVGASIFLVSFFVNLGIVSLILVKLPADHFSKKRKTKFWAGPRPAIHAAKVIGKKLSDDLLSVVEDPRELTGDERMNESPENTERQ